MSEGIQDQAQDRKTWNSKLIVTLAGIAGVTAMAIAGTITGGVAVPIIIGMVGGYTGYREMTSPHRQ
jgi:NhaP-type Na+/H+ or K+/H+ antiporter